MRTTTTATRLPGDDTTADAETAAYTIYRRYRQWVDYGTMLDAARRHMAQHPDLLDAAPKKRRRALRAAAERKARYAKAAASGYRVDDEVFYSLPLIDRLLPYALDGNATTPPSVVDAGSVNRQHAGKADGYGGWESAVSDVRGALRKLPPRSRAVLQIAYRSGVTSTWLAHRLGQTLESLTNELRRNLAAIQRTLGGSNPWPA